MQRPAAVIFASSVLLHASSAYSQATDTTATEFDLASSPRDSGAHVAANHLELGIFGGVLMPSKDHNFHDEPKTHQEFTRVVPELGLRVGYFPLSFLGAELEGAAGFSKTEDDESATLWAARGHLLAQLPNPSFAPFVLGGWGHLGARSDSLGNDSDPAIHFGVGAKLPISSALVARLDLRDTLTQKNRADGGDQTHHPEALLGVSLVLGGRAAAPADRDRDGFVDAEDKCPETPGSAPAGCPAQADGDGDGIMNDVDACPTQRGLAPDGCPAKDGDGDGFPDNGDGCPTVKGVAPDGCPDPDPDKDGVLGADDKCPDKPETKNNYDDEDGCPDEVPQEVQQFTGTIAGIEFDHNAATIRPQSKPKLDEAVATLKKYPDLNVLITGHTDNSGTRARNLKLSKDRADAVRKYLVDKGIAAARIKTEGLGPDHPVADNSTDDGRQRNRRIEFKLTQQPKKSP